jgi:Asp/Glu/hydantoin racemase
MTIFVGGQNLCGATIGVLCLESYFPKPPGHIKNPSSLPFPVIYEIVSGVTVPKLLNNSSLSLIESFIKAAQHLESEGVRAITGSCGFLAMYQQELAAAVNIPVFASSLIQVPLAYQMTGGSSPVGVITADSKALTTQHFKATGAGGVPVKIKGLENSHEFSEVILKNHRTSMNIDLIEQELIEVVRELLTDNPEIRSLVLECTDLPPYAAQLQSIFKLPIFDLTTLACMAHDVVARKPYTGFMPY